MAKRRSMQFIERLREQAGSEEELLDRLDDMGLSISQAEGMHVIIVDKDDYNEPKEYYGDLDEVEIASRLETTRRPKADISTYIQEINKDQLLSIVKRFNPKTSAKTVSNNQANIEKALKSTKHIQAVIENLNPLEEELLLEVKRSGGVANGWDLVLHAIKLGFRPEESVEQTSLYRVEASEHPGAKFLLPLLQDALLLPTSTYASWFERFYYGYEQSLDVENDIVQVDTRLLDALPDKPSPKAILPKFKKLKDVTDSGFSQKHPIEAILKLTEVLKLIESSGGLQTKKDDSISKNAIKKLVKLAPWLEDEFESYLNTIIALGYLNEVIEEGKKTLQVNLRSFSTFQTGSLELAYSTLLNGYFNNNSIKYNPSGPQYGFNEVINIAIARKALIDAVCLIPDEAVDLDAALNLLWEHSLHYVMRAKVSRAYYGSDKRVEVRELPKWFRHSILQELHDFGLVALKELGKKEGLDAQAANMYLPEKFKVLDNMNYAVKTTVAKTWWQQATKPSKTASTKKAKIDPTQKSLLVQANFDILVYLDMLTPSAIAALNCADCTRIDAQTANYSISRSSVYRALEMGMELDNILELLEENSHDVPNNVRVSISEWASRRERLSVTENTNLLEYPTKTARDKAKKNLKASKAIAERFLLVPENLQANDALTSAVADAITTVHNYRAAPKRVIDFQEDGKFTLEGASDLAGRAVLANLAVQDSKGNYELDTKAIQAGSFTKAAHESLLARTKGSLPAQLSVLIGIWSGKTAAPAVGQVSIFQHASAKELSQHPNIAPLLDGQLGATSFLIKEAKATELNKVLKTLGITPSKTVEHTVQPKVVQEDTLKKGLPTRKMREMIESAIASEQKLKLKYNEEKHSYDRYGYTKISKGKSVTEEINPDSVYYEGSTPYFYGRTVANDKGRDIRIGYITEIAVL